VLLIVDGSLHSSKGSYPNNLHQDQLVVRQNKDNSCESFRDDFLINGITSKSIVTVLATSSMSFWSGLLPLLDNLIDAGVLRAIHQL
jgi:hypothetical protein